MSEDFEACADAYLEAILHASWHFLQGISMKIALNPTTTYTTLSTIGQLPKR